MKKERNKRRGRGRGGTREDKSELYARSPCIPEEWGAILAPLRDKDRSPFPPFSILHASYIVNMRALLAMQMYKVVQLWAMCAGKERECTETFVDHLLASNLT